MPWRSKNDSEPILAPGSVLTLRWESNRGEFQGTDGAEWYIFVYSKLNSHKTHSMCIFYPPPQHSFCSQLSLNYRFLRAFNRLLITEPDYRLQIINDRFLITYKTLNTKFWQLKSELLLRNTYYGFMNTEFLYLNLVIRFSKYKCWFLMTSSYYGKRMLISN